MSCQILAAQQQLKKKGGKMTDYTPSQLKEHLQWLYRQPNYFVKKNKWGGKREQNKTIVKLHEEWAKENGYRDKR